MQLRSFQQNDRNKIYHSWQNGNMNVLYVLPTGGGKTVVLMSIIKHYEQHQVIIAHRQELISQISLVLASNGIKHNLIASDKIIKQLSIIQIAKFNKVFIDPLAITVVASIDTLLRRLNKFEYQQWAKKIKLWIIDECHHVVKDNKWGKVLQSFHNAIGLGVTATPLRTDGKGLGINNHGLFHDMIVGPSMNDLMEMKFLSKYRIFCPPSDLDLSNVKLTNSGDFVKPQLSQAVEKSTIIGDAVSHYLKYANGMKGLTFCTSIKSAVDMTDRYNQAGISAMLVTAKTPIEDRINASKFLESGDLLQLVNVDIFGEGYDLPTVSCISFLRPTASLNLYMQQFGRSLRIAAGKKNAIIFDHVGNVQRHGLPDVPRIWNLEPKPKKTRLIDIGQETLITICQNIGCFAPYDSKLSKCPYCNNIKTINPKMSIKEIQGDLTELHPDTINRLKIERYNIDNPPLPPTAQGEIVRLSVLKRQRIRKEKQIQLRSKISQWAGNLRFNGKTDSEIYKIFYYITGIDILKAQTLGSGNVDKLMEKLQ